MAELTEELLSKLEALVERADPGPWRAMVEGRDHVSGDSFIMVGLPDDRREDMYVTRDSGPADAATLDLIAASATYLPILVQELRRLRGQ